MSSNQQSKKPARRGWFGDPAGHARAGRLGGLVRKADRVDPDEVRRRKAKDK